MVIDMLKLLKKIDFVFDFVMFVDDCYICVVFKVFGFDYDVVLKYYGKQLFVVNDVLIGKLICDFNDVVQVWFVGDEVVCYYVSFVVVFVVFGKFGLFVKVCVVFVYDYGSGLKLFVDQVWYVKDVYGVLIVFLLKLGVDVYVQQVLGVVVDYVVVKIVIVQVFVVC